MEPIWVYLSMSTTILLAFLIIKILFQTLLINNNEPKRLPPSPTSLPFIGHLHLLKDPIHQSLQNLAHKFGPIYSLRFGSRLVVVVSSPSLVEECLSKNDVIFANRPRLLMGKYLGYNWNTIITAPYGQHWRNLRRISSNELLSPHKLNVSTNIRMYEIKSMIMKLYKLSSCNGVAKIELKTVFSELTLNILMRMLVGKRYFGENLEDDCEEAKRISGIIKEAFEFSGATFPGDFVPILRLVDYGGYVKRCITIAKRTDVVLQGLVNQCKKRRLRSKDEETIVGRLICMQEGDPEYYTDDTIKGLLLVYLLAGTDTSSVTMEWAVSLLLNHPDSLRKAKSEIDTKVGQDNLIKESQLASLTYLNNIISETNRMYPPAPLLLPHLSSRECQIGGYKIPSNTMLIVNACAIQRDPSVWNCAAEFKPERFENNEEGVDQYKLMPFGVGRRSCPGEALANRMVGLALGSLIQCFDWEKISEKQVDLSEGRGLNLPKALPLEALCKPRPFITNIL